VAGTTVTTGACTKLKGFILAGTAITFGAGTEVEGCVVAAVTVGTDIYANELSMPTIIMP
jgi:hypothetical protein